jgi:hypothetical protein
MEHIAVTTAPLVGVFGIEPDGAVGAASHLAEEVGAGIVIVISSVANHDEGGTAVEGVQIIFGKVGQAMAEVGAVVAGREANEDAVDGFFRFAALEVGEMYSMWSMKANA